jgi:hypothetical protein
MAIHIFKPEVPANLQPRFASLHSHLIWLRRIFRLRARVQQWQQQTGGPTPAMDALYALALAVVDERSLD